MLIHWNVSKAISPFETEQSVTVHDRQKLSSGLKGGQFVLLTTRRNISSIVISGALGRGAALQERIVPVGGGIRGLARRIFAMLLLL
jgi:hypothetical protein